MTSCHIIHIGTLSMNRFWGETERVREPSATCTLIVAGGQRLLVDPSPHPDALERALADRTGLRPADIDLVYLTHFHGDHRFGLSLFEDRPLLMAEAGIAEWIGRSPGDAELAGRFCPAEDRLPAGVGLLHTPGHTRHHCSLRLQTPQCIVVVAGDAVMTRDFFAANEGFHNSVDPVQASETIAMIRATADMVIPGHDNLILAKEAIP